MAQGGLIIRQITLFKAASGRNFLNPGSKFISILLDTAEQGFDVCTANGLLRSVNPYRWNRRTTKHCSNFATLTDAEKEFEKRVRLANDDGFTLNALHAVPPPSASE